MLAAQSHQLSLLDSYPQLEVIKRNQADDEIARWKRAQYMRGFMVNYETAYAVGEAGEQLILQEIESVKGIRAQWTGRKKRKVADIRLTHISTGETSRLEVKTARKGKSGYQFMLQKKDKHGSTDIKDADFVLLQAITPAGAIYRYLIPTMALTAKKITIKNPQRYTGIYAQYEVKRACIQLICQSIFEVQQ